MQRASLALPLSLYLPRLPVGPRTHAAFFAGPERSRLRRAQRSLAFAKALAPRLGRASPAGAHVGALPLDALARTFAALAPAQHCVSFFFVHAAPTCAQACGTGVCSSGCSALFLRAKAQFGCSECARRARSLGALSGYVA